MWPFGRKQEVAPPAEPAAELPQVRFDWKGMPAIQRMVAAHPLTVQTARFASDLATHADPRAVAQPLGHQVSLEAPPGLVLDFVRPLTRSDGPELVTRPRAGHRPPVQRAATESIVPDLELADVASAGEAPSVSAAPRRQLSVAAVPPPTVQLMHVTPETEPRPLANAVEPPTSPEQRVETAAVSESPFEATTEVAAYPRLTLGQARRLGLGAPMAKVPDSATSVQRAVEMPNTPAPVKTPEPPRPEEAPQFQPFALDYLITKKAPTPAPTIISRPPRIQQAISVSRTAEPAEMTAEAVKVPAMTTEVAPLELAAEPGDSDQEQLGPSIQRAETAEIAVPPPLRADSDPKSSLLAAATTGETDGGSSEVPPLPLATRPQEPALQRLASMGADMDPPAAPPLALASDRGWSPSGDTGTTGPASDGAAIGPILADRPSIRTVTAPEPAHQSASSVAHPPHSSRAHVEHLGFAGQAAAQSAGHRMGQAAATPLLPAVQRNAETATRSIIASPPLQRTQRGPIGVLAIERGLRPAAAASASTEPAIELPLRADAPFIQRLPDAGSSLPLAHDSLPARTLQRTPQSDTSSGIEPGSPPWNSTVVGGPAAGGAAVASMQRAAVANWSLQAEAEAPAAEAAAAASSVGTTAASVPTAAPAPDDESRMEDLAGKLYGKIRARLRHELLVDRERAGFLTDLR